MVAAAGRAAALSSAGVRRRSRRAVRQHRIRISLLSIWLAWLRSGLREAPGLAKIFLDQGGEARAVLGRGVGQTCELVDLAGQPVEDLETHPGGRELRRRDGAGVVPGDEELAELGGLLRRLVEGRELYRVELGRKLALLFELGLERRRVGRVLDDEVPEVDRLPRPFRTLDATAPAEEEIPPQESEERDGGEPAVDHERPPRRLPRGLCHRRPSPGAEQNAVDRRTTA